MSLTPGTSGFLGITSITLVRRDPFPDLPPGVSAGERLKRFLQAVSLVRSPLPDKDKWRADIVDQQDHDEELEVTSHPVESGFEITDHSRKLPSMISFTGIISDSPFLPLGFPVFLNRALDERRKVLQFFNAREPVYVATSLGVNESMLIRSFRTSRSSDTGGALEVSFVLKELRIVEDVLGDKLIDDAAAGLGAVPATNGGTQGLF